MSYTGMFRTLLLTRVHVTLVTRQKMRNNEDRHGWSQARVRKEEGWA